MRKITLITGDIESGKTFLARSISMAFENTVWINKYNIRDVQFNIKENTDLIIVDEIDIKYFNELISMFSEEKIVVNEMHKEAVEINTPKVVFILDWVDYNELKRKDTKAFKRRFNTIVTSISDNITSKIFNYKKI